MRDKKKEDGHFESLVEMKPDYTPKFLEQHPLASFKDAFEVGSIRSAEGSVSRGEPPTKKEVKDLGEKN